MATTFISEKIVRRVIEARLQGICTENGLAYVPPNYPFPASDIESRPSVRVARVSTDRMRRQQREGNTDIAAITLTIAIAVQHKPRGDDAENVYLGDETKDLIVRDLSEWTGRDEAAGYEVSLDQANGDGDAEGASSEDAGVEFNTITISGIAQAWPATP